MDACSLGQHSVQVEQARLRAARQSEAEIRRGGVVACAHAGSVCEAAGRSLRLAELSRNAVTGAFKLDKPDKVTGDGFKDAFGSQKFTWHVVHPTGAGGGAGATSTPTYPGY